MQCLEKKPSDRPAGARAFRSALLECLDARNWGVHEAEKWWEEHDMRPRRSDGGHMAGTPDDDTSRIPEWRMRTERL